MWVFSEIHSKVPKVRKARVTRFGMRALSTYQLRLVSSVCQTQFTSLKVPHFQIWPVCPVFGKMRTCENAMDLVGQEDWRTQFALVFHSVTRWEDDRLLEARSFHRNYDFGVRCCLWAGDTVRCLALTLTLSLTLTLRKVIRRCKVNIRINNNHTWICSIVCRLPLR